jgi:Fe2+ transport system protein B
MEIGVLIFVVVLALIFLLLGEILSSLPSLIVNGIVGVVLIFLTNIFLADDLPINLLTILISVIGGVAGWLIILVLHLLGIAF